MPSLVAQMSTESELHVLTGVVDALPSLLGRVWGFTEDRPYTVVLRSVRLEPATIDSREGVGHGFLAEVEHPIEWLEAQLEKAHVLEICWAAGLAGCGRGQATMVITLAKAEASPSGAAEAQLVLSRSTGGPPGRRGGFFAQILVSLAESDGLWAVTDVRILGIT